MNSHNRHNSIHESAPRRRHRSSSNNQTPIEYLSYSRKSSEEDTGKQILSLGRQDDWVHRTATTNNHTIKYALQEEKSARTPYRRAVFDSMVAQIKRGDVRGIYVWKLDRLARNPEEAGIIIGMLSRGDIQHIVTSQRDYYPEDNAIISYVDFGLADQYSRDLSTNVRDGLHNRAQNGYFPGYAPLGYKNSKNYETGTNTILIDPDRFQKVKEAFQFFLTGKYSVPRLKEIADRTWHLTCRGGKKQVERPMGLSAWYKLFRNSFYYGEFEYPKGSDNWYRGKHKPMITQEEYYRVQVLLGDGVKQKKSRHNHPYRGLFKCGSCPGAVTPEAKIKRQKNGNVHFYTYYHCTKKIKSDCPERSIEIKELERQISDKLALLTISDDFKNMSVLFLKNAGHEDIQKHHVLKKNLEKELVKINQQLNNLELKFTSAENIDGEMFSNAEYITLKRTFQDKRTRIETELGKPEAEVSRYADEKAKEQFDLACNAQAQFLTGGNETKQNIVSRISSNRILKDQNIVLTLREPLNWIAKKRDIITNEISQVRTALKLVNSTDFANLFARCPLMCGLVHEVRTYFLNNPDDGNSTTDQNVQ